MGLGQNNFGSLQRNKSKVKHQSNIFEPRRLFNNLYIWKLNGWRLFGWRLFGTCCHFLRLYGRKLFGRRLFGRIPAEICVRKAYLVAASQTYAERTDLSRSSLLLVWSFIMTREGSLILKCNVLSDISN